MALKSSRERDRGGRRGGSSFKYQERDKESIRKRAEQQGGKFDSILKSGFDSWRPKDGENAIRILPPTWEDHDHYGYDIWVHSFVGPDKSTYLCPAKMLNKACPICKASREATAAGEADDGKQLSATRRVAVWILDREDDTPTPKLWTMSWSMDRDIAALCQNKRTGKVLLIDHPQHGYDVLFNKSGKGLNTRYVGMAVDREETPALEDEGELESALEYIQENPIPEILNFYDEKYLANMIEGTSEAADDELANDEDDDERDRKPARNKAKSRRDEDEDEDEDDEEERKPSRKSSRRDEDEEEDLVDEDEDEDAEEERKPSRKSSRRRDEDEDEDEDDEEERKPSRKSSRRDEDDEEDDDAVEERTAARNKAKSRRDEDEDEDEDDDPAPRKSSGRDRQPSRRR